MAPGGTECKTSAQQLTNSRLVKKMKVIFIILGAIFAYFGISLGLYIVLTKIDPYDPGNDPYGDGDENKGVAIAWPVTIPVLLIGAIGHGISHVFDMVRKDITG